MIFPLLQPHLPNLHLNLLNVSPQTTAPNTKLNHNCGSEYVQNTRSAPHVYNGDPLGWGDVSFSVDGDVDRVVGFVGKKGGGFELFDGDRMNALITRWILRVSEGVRWEGGRVKVGVVQVGWMEGSYVKRTNEKRLFTHAH